MLVRHALLALSLFFLLHTCVCYRKAMTVTDYSYKWGSQEANQTLSIISELGGEWVSIIITWFQQNINTTAIAPKQGRTATDEELIMSIKDAHDKGLKVLLKPHVDNENGEWRAHIGKYFDDTQWEAWFTNYNNFLQIFANIASENNVEAFCVGVEYIIPSSQSSRWRDVISSTRKNYKGEVTYACSRQNLYGIDWWDAVDIIGVDAYYPLTTEDNPSKEELLAGWKTVIPIVMNASIFWKKDVYFTEVGYKSIVGTAKMPSGNNGGPVNITQQLICYEALYETWSNISWWQGAFWWNWDTNPAQEGKCDTHFTPKGKPAENYLAKTWGGTVPPRKSLSGKSNMMSTVNNTIYDNGSDGKGWFGCNWKGTYNDKSTDELPPGKQYSLKAETEGYGALCFGTNTAGDLSGFKVIQFSLRTSSNIGDGSAITIGFELSSGKYPIKLQVASYSGCTIPNQQWISVSISLDDLKVSGETVSRLVIQNTQSTPGTFWIDQLVVQ